MGAVDRALGHAGAIVGELDPVGEKLLDVWSDEPLLAAAMGMPTDPFLANKLQTGAENAGNYQIVQPVDDSNAWMYRPQINWDYRGQNATAGTGAPAGGNMYANASLGSRYGLLGAGTRQAQPDTNYNGILGAFTKAVMQKEKR